MHLAFYYVLGINEILLFLDESLAFLIIMLTAKYNIDFYETPMLPESRERNRFTYMAIKAPSPNKITF